MATTSPDDTAKREACCGLSASALPHTCLVSGFGHSCSQALLENLPSHTQGSGRRTIVSAVPGATGGETCGSFGAPTDAAARALPPITPSCKARVHHSSNWPGACDRHVSRTRSYGDASGRPISSASNSCSVQLGNSGRINGCTRLAVPSLDRKSDHASNSCVCGTCHSESAAVSSA